MNSPRRALALAGTLAVFTLAAGAQVQTSRELQHGVGVLDSGVTLNYKTMLEPAEGNSTANGLGGGVFHASGSTMQHCLYDRVAAYYFGYAMTVLPGPTPATRKVVFAPVDLAAIRDSLRAVAGDLPLNPAPLPKYPPPQTVRSGDSIAMDLMTSPDGSQRMVDYIKFSFAGKPPQPESADSTPPRDFTLDDGPIVIDSSPPEVAIDGKKFDGPVVMYPPQNGRTPWAYFPGQGRFVLSLAPRAELKKIGTVRGKRISFTWEGHAYEIRTAEPLAGVEKAWNLYIARDAAYLPRSVLTNAVVMSADRLENLVAK
jgi:hypothetical protein